jgi:hypothetical protein
LIEHGLDCDFNLKNMVEDILQESGQDKDRVSETVQNTGFDMYFLIFVKLNFNVIIIRPFHTSIGYI